MEAFKILLGVCLLVGAVSAMSPMMRLNNETGELEQFYNPEPNCTGFDFATWVQFLGAEGSVVVDPVYESLNQIEPTELPEPPELEPTELPGLEAEGAEAEAVEVEAAEAEAAEAEEQGAARRRRSADSEEEEGGEEYAGSEESDSDSSEEGERITPRFRRNTSEESAEEEEEEEGHHGDSGAHGGHGGHGGHSAHGGHGAHSVHGGHSGHGPGHHGPGHHGPGHHGPGHHGPGHHGPGHHGPQGAAEHYHGAEHYSLAGHAHPWLGLAGRGSAGHGGAGHAGHLHRPLFGLGAFSAAYGHDVHHGLGHGAEHGHGLGSHHVERGEHEPMLPELGLSGTAVPGHPTKHTLKISNTHITALHYLLEVTPDYSNVKPHCTFVPPADLYNTTFHPMHPPVQLMDPFKLIARVHNHSHSHAAEADQVHGDHHDFPTEIPGSEAVTNAPDADPQHIHIHLNMQGLMHAHQEQQGTHQEHGTESPVPGASEGTENPIETETVEPHTNEHESHSVQVLNLGPGQPTIHLHLPNIGLGLFGPARLHQHEQTPHEHTQEGHGNDQEAELEQEMGHEEATGHEVNGGAAPVNEKPTESLVEQCESALRGVLAPHTALEVKMDLSDCVCYDIKVNVAHSSADGIVVNSAEANPVLTQRICQEKRILAPALPPIVLPSLVMPPMPPMPPLDEAPPAVR